MRLGTDLEVLPVKVLCPAKPEVDDPCADGVIAETIYEDEAPHIPVHGVGVKDHELIQRKVHTPISLRVSVFAAKCSEVSTLSRYLGRAGTALTVRVPSLSMYRRPGSIGCSCIQTMWASTWSDTEAGARALQIRSPRLTSTWSPSVKVTDWPTSAQARSPLAVTMRSTTDSLFDGNTRTRSPGRTV